MLILSRKLNESIIIDGRIVVKVLRIERDTVKLGIQAPAELSVHRQEVFDAIERARRHRAEGEASPPPPPPASPPFGSDPAPATPGKP